MHRTKTIEYVFMVDSELELELDGGEERMTKKGELLVQRANMHTWRNLSSTEGARMAVVCLGAEGAAEGGMEFPSRAGLNLCCCCVVDDLINDIILASKLGSYQVVCPPIEVLHTAFGREVLFGLNHAL